MKIDNALQATGFVFGVYLLALIVSVIVAGLIGLLSLILRRSRENKTKVSQKGVS